MYMTENQMPREIAMVRYFSPNALRPVQAFLVAWILWTGFVPGTALGHGGKTHGQEPFSAFQAVQKAAGLFDRLIVSGKLPETWETGLTSIQIGIRGVKDQREYVVRFQRSTGDPESVYFFFNRRGDYSGSNFTGP
jgi:Family of unknown function (DUF6488)